jgi:predicted GNAT family N-acyltransferase
MIVDMKDLSKTLNEDGQVARWPKDRQQRVLILDYLATKFDTGKTYHELEVNELLKRWHTFQDWSGLRRELVDRGYLTRNRDGTEYTRIASLVDYFAYKNISCRKFTTSDMSILTNIINSAYSYQDALKGRPRITNEELLARIQTTDLFVFEIKSEIVACVYTKVEQEALHFGLLTVDSSVKGQQLGAHIVKAIIAFATATHQRSVQLDYMSAAPWLKRYYEKLGFKETGDITEWGTINLIRMKHEIN